MKKKAMWRRPAMIYLLFHSPPRLLSPSGRAGRDQNGRPLGSLLKWAIRSPPTRQRAGWHTDRGVCNTVLCLTGGGGEGVYDLFQALGFLADSSETLIYYLFFDLYLLTFCFKVGSVMSCISLTVINNWHQKGLLLILKKVLTVEGLIYTSICMWQSKLTIWFVWFM